jgi:hypothetical protein
MDGTKPHDPGRQPHVGQRTVRQAYAATGQLRDLGIGHVHGDREVGGRDLKTAHELRQ